MPRRILACLLALSCWTWALTASAQVLPVTPPEKVGLASERLARIGRAIEVEIAKNQMPGAVILVARKGKVAYFESLGFGFAVRLAPGIAGVPGSAGEYSWAGYGGTFFWVDPAEQLVAIYLSQAPGPSPVQLRRLLKQVVTQAFAD